jgi:hypothetical protein
MLSLNSKHVQHVKIYLVCNFKVNLISYLEVIALVSEEKIFLTLANQKQELPLAAIFVGGMGRNEEIYRGPYIDAFCQVW